MEQVGYILGTREGKAQVEVRRISGCSGSCKSCSGCDTPSMTVELDNTLDAKIGDMVEIKGESRTILKYTFLIYMIPLFMLVLGLIIGVDNFSKMGYTNYELYGLGVGMVFLFLSFFLLKIIDNRARKKTSSMMKMVKIIN